jgi:hypothetical protein
MAADGLRQKRLGGIGSHCAVSKLKGQGLNVNEASLACFQYKLLRLTP